MRGRSAALRITRITYYDITVTRPSIPFISHAVGSLTILAVDEARLAAGKREFKSRSDPAVARIIGIDGRVTAMPNSPITQRRSPLA
jgi:hypothetical protein